VIFGQQRHEHRLAAFGDVVKADLVGQDRSLTALQPLLTTTEVTSPFSTLPIQTSVDGACRRPVVRITAEQRPCGNVA